MAILSPRRHHVAGHMGDAWRLLQNSADRGFRGRFTRKNPRGEPIPSVAQRSRRAFLEVLQQPPSPRRRCRTSHPRPPPPLRRLHSSKRAPSASSSFSFAPIRSSLIAWCSEAFALIFVLSPATCRSSTRPHRLAQLQHLHKQAPQSGQKGAAQRPRCCGDRGAARPPTPGARAVQ